MTAISPAQSRPPPSIPPPPNLVRAPRRQLSVVKLEPTQTFGAGDIESHSVDFSDDNRPIKRRKIDSPGASTPAATPARPRSATVNSQPGESQSSIKLSRVPWHFSIIESLAIETDEVAADLKPPPLPDRPWKNNVPVKTSFEQSKSGNRIRKDVPVPNIPDKLESPENAPKLGKSSLAGFFPWIGKHPEDVLNDSNIKHGFSDRALNTPEKEINSVHSALHATLKQKSGLETLSTIYSLVLSQRSKHGTISSSSTFKPPPRVTLTEVKRKSWLADLANAEVPLRRLSRTIPQGIRGQSLLDQCLMNSVPVSRALWFAKCVGANEIRTLKRKGAAGPLATGNEGKWLKEWTLNIEQFIEATVRKCDQPNWRSKIQYVLRLCTRLYLENLLDRDHYLNWTVKSFAIADMKSLPLWLMVLHAHKEDLIRFRNRGKRMAEALVEKLELLRASDEQILQPLILKLKEFVRWFVLSRPTCFLLPDGWTQCKSTLQYCLNEEVLQERNLIEHLRTINEGTAGSNLLLSAVSVPPRQMLIEVLDSAQAPFNIPTLVEKCRTACDDRATMVLTILDWSTTRFRHSEARIYLAARLLRHCHKHSYDIDTQILEFMTNSRESASIDFKTLHHLVAELSRSRTFSISRYLQWLSIRGALQQVTFSSPMLGVETGGSLNQPLLPQISSDTTQLLTEISLHHLDDHVINLRNIVLSRVGFEAAHEAMVIEQCKSYLRRSIPTITQTSTIPNTDASGFEMDFQSLPWTIRCNISVWLREQVVNFSKTHLSPDNSKAPLDGNKGLDVQEYTVLCDVFEQMGDIAMLADVLGTFSLSTQEDLLAATVDILNCYSYEFSALGAFEVIQQKLCLAYITLRGLRPFMPLLLIGLIDLCRQYPCKVISIRALQTDLVKGERGSAMAACSPFSDGVAESLQQAGPTFIEDFEAILQSEPNMNDQTMNRLFGVLADRIEKATFRENPDSTSPVLCQLLSRLRLYRVAQFDRLLEAWLSRILHGNKPGSLLLLVRLVSAGCTDFGAILRSIKRVLHSKSRTPSSLDQVIAELFDFDRTNCPKTLMHYRFNLSRLQYLRRHPLDLVNIVSEINTVLSVTIDLSLLWPSLLPSLVLGGSVVLEKIPITTSDMLSNGLGLLLQVPKQGTLDISSIIANADDLSLPFRKVLLKLLTRTPESNEPDYQNELATAFFHMASRSRNASSSKSNLDWSILLQATGPEIQRRVRQKAEQAFFDSVPSIFQPRLAGQSTDMPASSIEAASKYLDIASNASQECNNLASPSITAQLVERFSLFLKYLGNANVAPSSSSVLLQAVSGPTSAPASAASIATTPTTPSPDTLTEMMEYLSLLLQMTCLQRPAFSFASKQAQQDQIKVLVLLVSIALHPTVGLPPPLIPSTSVIKSISTVTDPVAFILDVAATLVDELSDEARILCTKFLKDKMKDPRVQFLLGSVNYAGSLLSSDVGAGLQLQMVKDVDGKRGMVNVGEWKVRQWEIMEAGSGREGESWVGLGVFGARVVKGKA